MDPIVFRKTRKLPNTGHNLHFIGFNASSFSSDVLIFFNKICYFFNKKIGFFGIFFYSAILIWNFLENFNNILNISKHENVIKGATMGMDNVKKNIILISLKNHHGNTIIWIVNFVFGIGCITCKVSTTKIWCKLVMLQKSFCTFKTFKFLFWTFKKISNILFLYQLCTIPFQNWRIFYFDD